MQSRDVPEIKFPKGHPSDPAGRPSDPPTLRRSGPRALRLALRPVQVPPPCSGTFGATSSRIIFATFNLRQELLGSRSFFLAPFSTLRAFV